MGKKKRFKADVDGSQVEDTEAEALEADDPTIDDEGNDIVTASKQDELAGVDGASPVESLLPDAGSHEDGALGKPESAAAPVALDAAGDAATDGASEGDVKKPEDVPSVEAPAPEAAPAEPATASTDEPKPDVGEAPAETKQGAITDMADLGVKAPDGTVQDDSNTTVMPEAPAAGDEAKETLAGEAAKVDGDDAVTAAPAEATATDAASSVAAAQAGTEAAQAAATSDEPAVGSAEALEQAEKDEQEAPKPVDPATLPGMAPVNTIGLTEAAGGIAPPLTAIDGVSKGEDVPALGDVHEAAKPIEEALDGATLDGLKAAGDQASDALHRLKDAELELAKMPDDAREIAAHVKAMGLHFVAALEALFKRQ